MMDNRRWEQLGAFGGIAFVIMQIVAQSLIQVGGNEPPFNAEAEEILTFFMNRNTGLFGIGDYLSILSLLPFAFFLGSLWARLRRAEDDPAWLSFTTVAFGLLSLTPLVSASGWTLAMARLNEGLNPEQARLLFDQGNLEFANLWVTLAGMLLAVSVLSIRAGALPSWLGWFGLVVAVGLLIARAFWASGQGAIFVPYVLFWLWLIVTSIVLIRRAGPSLETD